jgi:DNA mismatch endonuclease, patch repair protein
MDNVDAYTRSRMMATVRRKDTRPEMVVRRALHHAGARYRLHDGKLRGRPDIVLASRRVAIFVHGCFWHQHPDCRYSTLPSTRTIFWRAKFAANLRRDRRAIKALKLDGWTVFVVWECETRNASSVALLVRRVLRISPVKRSPAQGPSRSARTKTCGYSIAGITLSRRVTSAQTRRCDW